MDLIKQFAANIKKNNFFTSHDKLLLAVSGGIDSVVLCDLCKQLGFTFSMAHCNFQLRGEESERDEKFVKKLGKEMKVEVLVKKFDTKEYASEKKISIQEAARELRYQWFDELIEKGMGNLLITAHHEDDNIETLLMNFFRGTGLKGMTGIPSKTGKIRRPLLAFRKEELLLYAKENQLAWVEDSSNDSSAYTRNYFRNELIPALTAVYPQVHENLAGNIHRFEEIRKLYELAVGQLKKQLIHQKGNEFHIPVKKWMAFNNRALIYEIIADFGFTEKQIDELIRLAESQSGKYIVSPSQSYQVIRHRHWFIISPIKAGEAENIIIEENTTSVLFPGGELQIEMLHSRQSIVDSSHSTVHSQKSTGKNSELLNLDKIQFPLLLRKWKTGDYFYPLGMKKKKKISRFFIDQKLSKTEKENAWVLEMNDKIIWVLGHRIDERFKIIASTNKTAKLTFIPSH